MNATKEATGTCRCDKHSPILNGTFTANEMIDAYMRGQQSIFLYHICHAEKMVT